MRILHVVARSHRRGAELAALELTQELDALGHENEILALGLSHDGRMDPSLPPLVHRAGSGPDVLALAAYRLRQRLRTKPTAVVMAHGGWPVQVTALAVPRGGPLLVWQRILGFPQALWGPLHRVWWRTLVKRVDAAVALTTDLERELRRLGFSGPVWVIPNARRPERFENLDRQAETRELRRAIGVPADAPLLGFVGHFVDQKRPERAVEVLAAVRASGVPAHLVMAGDGTRRKLVERRIHTLGVGDHVSLLGHRADVEHVYAGVDLCLITSDAEGIPGVAIEAQMAGTPVVTFPLGGVAEVVEDGVTGVVLPSSDVVQMADATAALLRDAPRRIELGTEARRRTPTFAASRTALLYAEGLMALDTASRRPTMRSPSPRVVHLVATDDRRGAETFAKLLHEEMLTRGVASTIIAIRHGAIGNLPVPALGGPRWFPQALWRVRRHTQDADIVVAHGSVSLPVVVLSGIAPRQTVVYRSIGDPTAWQTTRLRRLRTRHLLSRCRHIVSVWDGGRAHLLRMYHLDRDRVSVIPNAYDDTVFGPVSAEERATARHELGLGDEPIVAFVGALTPEKRPFDALAAVARVTGARLVVAGDGPLGAELRRKADDSVRFLGAVSEVRSVYAASDVVLQTSQTEGMSAVLLEAAACGRAVVSTGVGAAHEVVEHDVTGEIVAVGDLAAISDALTRVLLRHEEMGAEAARRAASDYHIGAVTDRWIAQLEALVSVRS